MELWKKEISRIFNRLRHEFSDRAQEFEEIEASWWIFYEKQMVGLRIANDKQGTPYSIAFAEERLQLISVYAKGLARWGRF